jgi:hypothetical protein
MKLEAVVVCVNYSDFLAWTIIFNRNLFDNMIVVSSVDDTDTHRVCEAYHVNCIKVENCNDENGVFNKGKLINVGLSHLKYNDWVIHMDADIILPTHFREFVNNLKLDNSKLYSVDRLMCKSFGEFISSLCRPKPQYENSIFVHPRPFELGVRLANNNMGGWVPIGYFQMWNQGKYKYVYPTEHSGAARGDVQFTLKFSREKRELIPEIFAIHLETKLEGHNEMGANWNGRKTPTFGKEFLTGTEFYIR